jgi:hypothetical protein
MFLRRLLIHSLAALALASVACSYGLLSAAEVQRVANPSPDAAAADPLGGKNAGRIREGAKLIDQVGSFKLTGDRLTFFTADGSRRFNCLENLNLERITQMVADSPDPLEWRVSGLVTEYRGANYLLISHAVVKMKPTRVTTP